MSDEHRAVGTAERSVARWSPGSDPDVAGARAAGAIYLFFEAFGEGPRAGLPSLAASLSSLRSRPRIARLNSSVFVDPVSSTHLSMISWVFVSTLKVIGTVFSSPMSHSVLLSYVQIGLSKPGTATPSRTVQQNILRVMFFAVQFSSTLPFLSGMNAIADLDTAFKPTLAVAYFGGYAHGESFVAALQRFAADREVLAAFHVAVRAGRVAREGWEAYARGWRVAERMGMAA